MSSVGACPSFEEFYQALWDGSRRPFPWQSRLAARAACGDWPQAVAVPTGCGKTGCIEAAVWALASQADQPANERTAPTRLWWVVNRRALVDDTYRHASRIAKRLHTADDGGPVASVAERLRALAGDAPGTEQTPALEVVRLRSGAPRARPRNMAAPAIICSTIPMFGSRLLFRGHGSSRYTWSIDAALAGTDSLVLVAESHISTPLLALLEQIGRFPGPRQPLLPAQRARPMVVGLSATPHLRHAHDIITIDNADRVDPLIARRLGASKPLRTLRTSEPLADAVCKEIAAAVGAFTKAIVFINTPSGARATARRLREAFPTLDVIVATGWMRGHEAAATAAAVRQRLGMGVSPPEPTIVVATQILEVGSDLDADLVITQSCGAASLVQRLGRLNRSGEHPAARGVVIDAASPPPPSGPYPDIPEVLERLESAAKDHVVAASPERIRETLGELLDPTVDHTGYPVLSEHLVREWTKTTTPPPGEAPVEAFYGGFRPATSTVEVLWRAHIPADGEPLWPPVTSDETVGIPPAQAQQLRRHHPDLTVMLADDARTVTTDIPEWIRPGTTLIAHTTVGFLDTDGHWEPGARQTVADVAVLTWGLPLTRPALRAITGEPTPTTDRMLDALDAQSDEAAIDAATAAFAAELAMRPRPAPYAHIAAWDRFAAAINEATTARVRLGEHVVVQPSSGAPRISLPPPSTIVDVGDGLSFVDVPAPLNTLGAHSADTARRAAATARAIGVPERIAQIVVLAAEFHALGKVDPRFQRWLAPNWEPGRPLMSKSDIPRWRRDAARRAAGYPAGGRYEELSRRLAAAWIDHADAQLTADETDLLLHLIASLHGRGRPLLVGTDDPLPSDVGIGHEIGEHTVVASRCLTDTDWSQPGRFARVNLQYTPWGVAALEALLRQADWESSRVTDGVR